MKLKQKISCIILMTALVISGCYSPTITHVVDEPTREEENAPKSGGEITLPALGDVSLDPFAGTEDVISPAQLIFEPLIKIDSEGRIKPALARSWQTDEVHSTYTFILREDVKWHNNKAFGSDDVVKVFDEIMDKKSQRPKWGQPPYLPEFDNVDSYSAPDEYTFVISLYEPDADFLYDLALGVLPFVPEESLEEPETEEAVPEVIGTGPFKFLESSPTDVVLVRNEDYYTSKPYIEKVMFRFFPDDHSAKEAFKKREVDIVGIAPEDWGMFQNTPDVYLLQSPSRYLEFVALNHLNPLFSDAKVRRAMLYAIDRKKILQESFLGRGMLVDTPILPFSWAFNSGIDHISYRPTDARQLLEEAGWRDEDDDGILEKAIDGKEYKMEFELLVNMSNIRRYQAALQIEKDLREVGISMKMANTSWDELEDTVLKKRYDAALLGWKLAPNPDLEFMFSTQEIKSGYNFVSYSNPKLDEIFEKVHIQESEREGLLHSAQDIISDELPYLCLFSPNDLWAINGKVKGFRPNAINLLEQIGDWWIDDIQDELEE